MKKLPVVSVLVIALVAIAGLVFSSDRPARAGDEMAQYMPPGFVFQAGWRGHPHGYGGPPVGAMFGHCGGAQQERVDHMLGFVEGMMNFTPEQEGAWAGLAGAVRNGSQRMAETCETVAKGQEPETAPEKLAVLEAMLSARLDMLKEVRVAFDSFYATLSDKQREALDDMMKRRRGHRFGPWGMPG